MSFKIRVKCLSKFCQVFKFRFYFLNKAVFISSVFSNLLLRRMYLACLLIISLLGILFFSSCSHKKSEKNPIYSLNSFNKKGSNYILLNEAKYSDIPIPVGFKTIKSSNQNSELLIQSEFLSYQGNLNLKDTIDFYSRALEREGWMISDFSSNDEGLLVCSKPTKQCVISLRKLKKNKTNVYIFIKKKQDKKVIFNDINSKDISFIKDNLEIETKFEDFSKG